MKDREEEMQRRKRVHMAVAAPVVAEEEQEPRKVH